MLKTFGFLYVFPVGAGDVSALPLRPTDAPRWKWLIPLAI